MTNLLDDVPTPFPVPPTPDPTPPTPINLGDIAAKLEVILGKELSAQLADAHADVAGYVSEIAPVLVSAAAAGDTALTAELEGQLKLLADKRKIKAVTGGWKVAKDVANVAIGALSAGLSAVLGGLKLPAVKLILLTALCLSAGGCGMVGTVDTSATSAVATPVLNRVDGYIASGTFTGAADLAAYSTAKANVVDALSTSPDRVSAKAILSSIVTVCDYHDTLVKADVKLDAAHKSTYLRSTTLLRQTFSEAAQGLGDSSTAPAVGVK